MAPFWIQKASACSPNARSFTWTFQEDLEQPEADAIAHLVFEAARIQANLLLAKYFVRGAITIGQCHFHRGVLFGPALVEAVNLEQNEAVDPRIVLSPNAVETLREGRGAIVEREPILIDEDGLAFVSYLQSIYEDPAASKPANLAKHARVLVDSLTKGLGDMHRWRKYRSQRRESRQGSNRPGRRRT